MERDFTGTGASGSGPSLKWVKVKTKEGLFELPNGTKSAAFEGYLEKINMNFKPADSANDLPDRWNINLVMAAKMEGHPDGGAQYCVSLSSHWSNPVVSSVLNGIRGALEDKRWEDPMNRRLRIYLYVKEVPGKRDKCCALTYFTAKGDYLPNFFAWNKGLSKHDGVPSDMGEADVFWLGVAHGLVKLTGGVVTGNDTASYKLPPPSHMGEGVQAEQPTTSSEPTLVERSMKYFGGRLDIEKSTKTTGDAFLAAVDATFKAINKNSPDEKALRELASQVTKVGLEVGAIPYGYIDHKAQWIQTAPATAPATPDPIIPTDPLIDDLPF